MVTIKLWTGLWNLSILRDRGEPADGLDEYEFMVTGILIAYWRSIDFFRSLGFPRLHKWQQ